VEERRDNDRSETFNLKFIEEMYRSAFFKSITRQMTWLEIFLFLKPIEEG
jgi:hypothetical protein